MITDTDNAPIETRIADLDTTLFRGINTQSTLGCQRSLLAVHDLVARAARPYSYLEIGSHLGGSLQAHYQDRRCRIIYSIDKRPPRQWDERGQYFYYNENSTSRMLTLLHRVYPRVTPKIVPYDGSTETCRKDLVQWPPALAFIDGEHTVESVYRDFRFCYGAMPDGSGIVLFHDTWIVYNGISLARRFLMDHGVAHEAHMLMGDVFCLLIGDWTSTAPGLQPVSQPLNAYLDRYQDKLNAHRHKAGQTPLRYLEPHEVDPDNPGHPAI